MKRAISIRFGGDLRSGYPCCGSDRSGCQSLVLGEDFGNADRHPVTGKMVTALVNVRF